ncbi:MAG: SurA N-terminal domain-containing protein [Rickettsiales bacterium]|nr:SurA N-terminal domain-containing protein [Rickettsiales bacterium]
MQLFRKLANHIVSKILLAFISLCFILFGVGDFILSGPTVWVAKVGGKTISQNAFMKEMQKNRDMILQANKGEEAQKYLESEQFKSDTLNRMVNGIIIEKLRDNTGVTADKNLILQEVAKDQNFKGQDGKFDHALFKNFLKKNGIDEEEYVKLAQDEIATSMIIQTLAMAAPINDKIIAATEEFKKQTRVADVIKVTVKDIARVDVPSEEDQKKFFEENKKAYGVPEYRKVSYLKFSRKDFAGDMKVTDEEVAAEYEKSKEQLQKPESRDFYHIVFDKEEDAKNFITKLDADKSKMSAEFVKLAKEIQKKNQKDITLSGVREKDLIPEISSAIFKLSVNEHSVAVKSPLGFHVFLLNKINESQVITLAEVKDMIKKKLVEAKQDKVLQDKITKIDDNILTSNSLQDTAAKFSLKFNATAVLLNQEGLDKNGKDIVEIRSLENFAANAFSLQKNQASKLFYSKSTDEFYSIKVEEVDEAHERKFEEVRAAVVADLSAKVQYEKLQDFVSKINSEIKADPKSALQIAYKHHLTVEKNKEFPRFMYINYQGRQIPYPNKFLEELFSVRVGETVVNAQSAKEFEIGVLREVKQQKAAAAEIEKAKEEVTNAFRNDAVQGYNSFMMKKYPIKINEKFFAKEEKDK